MQILYDYFVWSYAAVMLGAVVLAFGVGRRLFKRRSRSRHDIDMGQLGDTWLAEQRGNRDRSRRREFSSAGNSGQGATASLASTATPAL